MVNHVIPTSLEEALSIIQDGSYMVLAGGTDLMVQHRATSQTAPQFKQNVCYISHLNELKYIAMDATSIHVGALTTLEDMLHSTLIPDVLKEVIRDIASPGIRYLATLAGNICHASPAGDTLVYLYAVDAHVCLQSQHEKRMVPIQEFIIGPRKTIIRPDEIMTEIIMPIRQDQYQTWVKVGPRKADAISKVSFVGLASRDGNKIVDFRVAWGAVYQTVLRKPDIEKTMIGMTWMDLHHHIDDIMNAYDPWIKPIDDQRSTKEYRKKVALNLLNDFIITCGKEGCHG